MPLFSRADGDLIKTESPVRVIVPYIMKGRNESVAYSEAFFDMTRTLPWLESYNKGRPPGEHATVFNLFQWTMARLLHDRPGINRFVSGGRLYQRKEVTISFVAKKEMKDGVPFVSLKLPFPKGESFRECVRRLRSAVEGGRHGPESSVDKEVRILTKLPGFMLRAGVALLKWLDFHNLMPYSMIKTDPMFCSVFVANLGSLGVGAAYHHLYEWGNTSLFAVMGKVEKHVFIDGEGKPVVKDGLEVRWSFDERINDGLYGANSLRMARDVLEDPGKYIKD
jgi:hypothetical protein